MEKYGFVYIWFDTYRKRFYIGCHWGYENDGYICSSDWMRKSFRRRPDDFKRRIITRVYSTRQELIEIENKYLSLIKDEELGKKYYNLTKHMNGHWSSKPDKLLTVGEKISKSRKGKHFGPMSEENKQKLSEAHKGKVLSEEHKEKLRNKIVTEETKLKMSEAHKGKFSQNKGRKHSEETKRKMSEGQKGVKCIIDGIEFDSIQKAVHELCLPWSTINNRLKSKHQLNYIYVEGK